MKAEMHKGQNGTLIINNIHNNYKLGDGAARSLFFGRGATFFNNSSDKRVWATVSAAEKKPKRV